MQNGKLTGGPTAARSSTAPRRSRLLYALAWAALCGVLTACTGVPEGISPVEDFDVQRYLGTWYEIARLDHSFERGLTEVTAQYKLRDDGTVTVINSGRNENGEWQDIEGKARFVGEPTTGHLKVSFFGPFYGSYIIFELDEADYEYAFVSGYNRDYLWLLARSPQVSDDLKQRFLERVSELGFDTGELIFVDQPTAEP